MYNFKNKEILNIIKLSLNNNNNNVIYLNSKIKCCQSSQLYVSLKLWQKTEVPSKHVFHILSKSRMLPCLPSLDNLRLNEHNKHNHNKTELKCDKPTTSPSWTK